MNLNATSNRVLPYCVWLKVAIQSSSATDRQCSLRPWLLYCHNSTTITLVFVQKSIKIEFISLAEEGYLSRILFYCLVHTGRFYSVWVTNSRRRLTFSRFRPLLLAVLLKLRLLYCILCYRPKSPGWGRPAVSLDGLLCRPRKLSLVSLWGKIYFWQRRHNSTLRGGSTLSY